MTDNVRSITAMLDDNYQEYKNMTASPFSERESCEWLPPHVLDESDEFPKITLLSSDKKDVLSSLAKSIAGEVQFPANTAFLHGLGCIATAMNKSFKYEYFGTEAPVNLYVVSSQPPSTGKSSINNAFSKPIRMAFADFNKEQSKKRALIEIKMAACNKEIKGCADDNQLLDLLSDMQALEEQLAVTPIYKYSISNATPEALEKVAFAQGGIWNIVSDEAGSINTVLGSVYGDSGKPSNSDLILQGWDGDYFSSCRIGRGSSEGYTRGAIAVIAQDETIKTILKEGERGNGISERFLLMREKNLLGMRDHFKDRQDVGACKIDYAKIVRELVFAENTVLKFSDEAKDFIKAKKQELEPLLADGARYSNSMLRGAVGKMDKQVCKISCVLHAAEYAKDGRLPIVINASTVKWAYEIYSELMKTYESAAQSQGYAGEIAEINAVLTALRKFTDSSKYQVKIRQLRDVLRNLKVFSNRKNFTNYLKDTLLPKCGSLNYCKINGDDLHISPKL